jgi:hypothetical protein
MTQAHKSLRSVQFRAPERSDCIRIGSALLALGSGFAGSLHSLTAKDFASLHPDRQIPIYGIICNLKRSRLVTHQTDLRCWHTPS